METLGLRGATSEEREGEISFGRMSHVFFLAEPRADSNRELDFESFKQFAFDFNAICTKFKEKKTAAETQVTHTGVGLGFRVSWSHLLMITYHPCQSQARAGLLVDKLFFVTMTRQKQLLMCVVVQRAAGYMGNAENDPVTRAFKMYDEDDSNLVMMAEIYAEPFHFCEAAECSTADLRKIEAVRERSREEDTG